jgi:hypothetical protein
MLRGYAAVVSLNTFTFSVISVGDAKYLSLDDVSNISHMKKAFDKKLRFNC